MRFRTRSGLGVAALVTAAIGLGLTGAYAAVPVAEASAIPATVDCAALSKMDLSHVRDAAGTVTSATVTTVNGHEYCDVRGTIRTQTRFEIQLPTTGWQGQYLQQGCEGLCGAPLSMPLAPAAGINCDPANNGQLVLGIDNGGHTGNDLSDGHWGEHDPAARVVFGLTSEHSLAQLARAVITKYYGRPATHTYFDGCSTGGRQGLMLAQRYPTDFDGILAGAPVSNLAPLSGMLNPWEIQANTGADRRQILTVDKLPALHAAVIRECADAYGVIDDPRQCAFQPSSIQCPPGTDTSTCLTPAQVAVVRALYRGPTDAAGRSLYNGGQAYGSELAWQGTFMSSSTQPGAAANTFVGRISLDYLKYLAYQQNPPTSFTLADVRFTDAEFARLNLLGDEIYNANNPDLTAFRAHGGKLILYHGWADSSAPAWSTIDYYAAVERVMGGFTATQSFSRLYLVPGAYHCMVGPDSSNPSEIAEPELLMPLINWVEQGLAPAAIDAPIISGPDYTTIVHQTLQPYDALAPVWSAPGSLNTNYRYIGTYPGPNN
jgi:hypothetical protein